MEPLSIDPGLDVSEMHDGETVFGIITVDHRSQMKEAIGCTKFLRFIADHAFLLSVDPPVKTVNGLYAHQMVSEPSDFAIRIPVITNNYHFPYKLDA